MEHVRLGKTDIVVNKNGFGALPIQRISVNDAVFLLQKAFRNGITFFDTARFYTDSEVKLGIAFEGMRDKVFIASKTGAATAKDFWKDLDITLSNLKTDYLDLYQFHNPDFCPRPGDESGLYDAMLQAKEQGKIRHIGITNHRFGVAEEAIESDLYETLQFPFSYLSQEKEITLVEKCRQKDMGFLAMKALAGGLITNSSAAYAFLAQEVFSHVLPIWGVQRKSELDEFITYIENPPVMTEELQDYIMKDRQELSKEFCRGCGYCMPCPVGVEINTCARMSLLIRRAPSSAQLTEDMQKKMLLIDQCRNCGACKDQCPYNLDTPALLKKNLEDYLEILAGKTI